jgi:hypothetical protein
MLSNRLPKDACPNIVFEVLDTLVATIGNFVLSFFSPSYSPILMADTQYADEHDLYSQLL